MTGNKELSPECRLVYLTAPESPDIQAIDRCLDEDLNWARVAVIAEGERASPVLWKTIGPIAKGRINSEAAEHLKKSAMVYDFRMLRLESRIQNTIKVLRERDIPVLLLKGAAMVASVYGSFTKRPMSDIDILIRREDAARARQAVIDSGWPETTDPALLELLKDAHHMPHFTDSEPTGLRVELHTHFLPLTEPFVFDEDDLWKDSIALEGKYQGASVASPVHRLYHACLHYGWSHSLSFGAWRTFRDTDALVRDGSFDWPAFTELARRSKGATSCYWTLRLAQRMSGVSVPDSVLVELAPPTPKSAMNALERHLININAPGEAPPCPSTWLQTTLWKAAIRPKWSGHGNVTREDPEHTWERTMGTASTETTAAWLLRHVKGVGSWLKFATRTLLPF